MPETIDKPATYADIEALPPNVVGEILFGRLVTHPRPTRRHGGAASILGVLLGGPYQLGVGGPGGWIFVDEPELHLGDDIVVPDIAGWRVERVTEPAEQAHFEVPPDWVCELMSPRTEAHDRGEKRRIYASNGVAHLWYFDPRVPLMEIFERQDMNWLLLDTIKEDGEINAPPFPELTFALDLLMPFDKPPT